MEPSSSQSSKPKTKWIHANYPSKLVNKFAPKKSLKQFIPPTFIDLPADLTPVEIDQFLREQRVDELTRKFRANVLELGDPDIRDPSPPPTYDPNGVRVNSREIRTKRAMEDEFGRLNRFLEKRVPGYVVPSDLQRPSRVYKKIQIPTDIFPDINFIALIVGPRGINHKRLQDESRCRIEFRGKDSSSTSQSYEESTLPLHVHIEGDCDEDVEVGVSIVTPLLDPSSPEFRATQQGTADQMALISGGVAAISRCTICQGTGHTASNCPDMVGSSIARDYTTLTIKCAICGGKGHLTSDCPVPKRGAEEEQPTPMVSSATPSGTSTPSSTTPFPPVMISTHMIGAFIGQGGANIKKLMVESGCNIQVDQSTAHKPGVTECPIVIHGPRTSVPKAMELCREWIKSHLQAREDRQQQYYQQQQVGVHGKFSDADAAANAVQMAYMQQLYWQQWMAAAAAQGYQGYPPPGQYPPGPYPPNPPNPPGPPQPPPDPSQQ